MASVVWAGSPPSPPLLDHDDWTDLDADDFVKTDADGQAELQLVGCSGSLYVFSGTAIQVSPCTEQEAPSGIASCAQFGTGWFNIDCTQRFTVDTYAGRVTVVGTAFSVTYVPQRRLLLVTVLDGKAEVRPVIDFGRGELAERAIPVEAGQFLYTMPGPQSPEIPDVPARTPRPFRELPFLVEALPIGHWIDDIELWAEKDGVLPGDWPSMEIPGLLDVSLQSGGGALEDVFTQEAVLTAIDKDEVLKYALPGQDVRFSSFLDGKEVDARTFSYDPGMALALLDEGNYANGFAATLVFPEDDEQLKMMAEAIAKDMDKVGIVITLESVPAEKLDTFVGSMLEEGVEVLWLERR